MSSLDRKRAEAAIDEYDRKFDSVEAPSLFPGEPSEWMRDLLDALEACSTPAPAHTIDRDSLLEVFDQWDDFPRPDEAAALADAVLALVRPVEGVVLSREEAEIVRRHLAPHAMAYPHEADLVALAARLDGSS